MLREVEVTDLFRIEDLRAIAEIEKEVFGEFAWSWNMLIEEFKNPVGKIVTLRTPQEVIGYLLWRRYLDEAEILRLAIASSYQGRGYGRYLLRKGIEVFKNAGVKEVYLEVDPTNERAIRLYESEGFFKVGLRRGYYENKRDALILKLNLGG